MRALMLVLVLAGSLLSGCTPGGVTIRGSIIGYYYDIGSTVTVTVTRGSTAESDTFVLSTVGPEQSGSFKIEGVPEGTYTIEVSFETDFGIPTSGFITYSINGSVPAEPDSITSTGSTTFTNVITIDSVEIDGDTDVDVDLGDLG